MIPASADAFECPEPCCIATCADACTWADCPLQPTFQGVAIVWDTGDGERPYLLRHPTPCLWDT